MTVSRIVEVEMDKAASRGSTISEPRQTANDQPRRVQLSRAKGWRMPPDTVKVDRTTPWGNPFRLGEPGVKTAADAVRFFRYMLAGYLPVATPVEFADMRRYRVFANDHLYDLRGKNLACWCRKGQPCHADVLLDLARTAVPVQPGSAPTDAPIEGVISGQQRRPS